MIDTFLVICFAIPIINFTGSVLKDRGYIEGYAAAERATMAAKRQDEWKQKDGKVIKISTMHDEHLANSLKMIARQWAEGNYVSKVTGNIWFKALALEAQKRGFRITHLKEPVKINGRMEYVDVYIPPPSSKIAANFFPTDWDSRPQG
jgi:hypothetical protein